MTLRPRFTGGHIWLIALICIVTIGACAAGCIAGSETDPISIGVLLPASGPLAMHSPEGLAWAAEAMNRQGGVGGRMIEVVYRDTSAGNISAYAEELAGRDDIEIVVGPATGAELTQIAPLVTKRGKLLITPSVTAESVTESDLVWRTCPTDGRQTEAIFRILRETGVRNVSLVTADTPYGETFARLAPDAAAAMGVGIAGAASVNASDDFAKIAAQIGEEKPEMVVAAVYPEEAVRLAEALAASLRWVVSGDGITKGWDPQEATEAAAMIRAGGHPAITGASGPLRFAEDPSSGPLAGYYTHWTVEGGEFCEGTPVASPDLSVRLPGLPYDPSPGTVGERPVVWMVYPLAKGDRSFADTAYRGLFRAQESFSFDKRECSYDDLALLDAVFSAQNFTEKPDLVITEGFEFTAASRAWAEANPEIRFFTLEQADFGLPNACDVLMVPYGASYLAGVMAANMTATGRIGAIAGAPVAVIDPFVEGFRAGAGAYDPAVNVTVRYVGESFEGFGMPGRAGALTQELRAESVDVILMIAGSSNTGIVDAARESRGVYLIGEDTDQSYLAPTLVAASVVKQIDAIVYHAVENEMDGRFTPGREVWTLQNGGTGLFVSPRFEEYAGLAADWQERAIAAENDYLKTAAL